RVAVPDAGSDTSGILRVPAGPAPVVRVAGARAVVAPVPAAQDVAPPADGGPPAVPVTGSTPASHEARAVGLVAVITAGPDTPYPETPSSAATASQPAAAPTAHASPTSSAPTSSAPTRSSAPALAPTSRPAPTTGTPSAHVPTPPRTTTTSTPAHGIGDDSRAGPRTTTVPATGGRGGHPDGDDRDDQRGDGRHHHDHGAWDGDGRRDHASPAHPTGDRPADSAEDRRQPSASRQPQR
ncbi:MAG: hypothetical protein JWR28_2127, partial [Modestobacter sp.]|nr:hypothetical protein [Modestobacter sp.]